MTTDSDKTDLSFEAKALLREGRLAFTPDSLRLEMVCKALDAKLGLHTPQSVDGASRLGGAQRAATRPSVSSISPANAAIAKTVSAVPAGLASSALSPLIKGVVAVVIAAMSGGIGYAVLQSRPATPAITSGATAPAVHVESPVGAESPTIERVEDAPARSITAVQPAANATKVAGNEHGAQGSRSEALRRSRKQTKADVPAASTVPMETAPVVEPEPSAANHIISAAPAPVRAAEQAATVPERWAPEPYKVETRPARTVAPAPVHDSPLVRPLDVNSLGREIALIQKARAALKRNDYWVALQLLEQHAARFPAGVLREERLATKVFALCAQNRTEEARATMLQLTQTAPESPYVTQLKRSCVGSE